MNQMIMKTRMAANLAFGEGTDDQAAGDGREGALEDHEDHSEMTTPLEKVAPTDSGVMPLRNSLSSVPKKALPSVKAAE